MMQTYKQNSGWKIFLVGFLVIIILMAVSALRSKRGQALQVPQNKGMARLQTVDGSLVAVFQDGQTYLWDWNNLSKPGRQFRVPSDRAVFLAGGRLGVANKSGVRLFSLYDLQSGGKIKEIRVGAAEGDIWPAVSPDQRTVMITRKVAGPGEDRFDFEFMILDLKDELLSPPVVVPVDESNESIVDFAVTDDQKMVAAGMANGRGLLLTVDLQSGVTLWNRSYENTKEFCSLVISPNNMVVYAGNRDGKLYKVDTINGDVIEEITLLQEGETRPITNDVSVLNLSMDSKGQYVAATITPFSYVVNTQTDTLIYRWHSAYKLSSKIAFSPDNRYVATSDIRAGWPVDIWELEKLK